MSDTVDELQEALENARRYARAGGVVLTRKMLGQVRALATQKGVELPPSELEELERTACRSAVENYLTYARRLAAKGLVEDTKNWLEEAKRYTIEAGIEIPPSDLREIERTACRNGVGPALRRARLLAGDGLVEETGEAVAEAKRRAARVEMTLSEPELQEIERLAYGKRVESALIHAQFFARRGLSHAKVVN